MKRALLIGIDSYPEAPLNSCLNDVEALQKVLQTGKFDIELLREHEATRGGIMAALARNRRMHPEFTFLYFSGHGCRTDVESYLVTWEAEEYAEGISLHELAHQLQCQNAQNSWVAVLDCCHAGAAWLPTMQLGLRSLDIADALAGRQSSRAILAACGEEDRTFAGEVGGLSAFTERLAEALGGLAADAEGNVTLTSLWQYLEATQTDDAPQSVLRGDLRGSLVIIDGLSPGRPGPTGHREVEAICEEAERLLAAYRPIASQDREVWAAEGWDLACRRLEPITRWFRKAVAKHPEWLNDARIRDIRRHINDELASLARVSEGYRNSNGTVVEERGSGAFGTVWRMKDEAGMEVAVKIYHSNYLADTDKADRFRHGYEAMKALSHPNIVRVRALSEVPLSIAMEYVDGPDLRGFGQGLDAAEDVIGMLVTLAQVLEFAHLQGVVHRDIKPENVLVRYSPEGFFEPVVTDFDLAWFPTATQLTVAGIGHPLYAAPEQLAHPGSSASRSPLVDIYALGQIAYFMVTGADPLPSIIPNVARFEEAASMKWDKALAAKLTNFYLKCTAAEPERRYPSMKAAAQGLAALVTSVAERDLGTAPEMSLSFENFIARVASRLRAAQSQVKSRNTAILITRSGISVEIGVGLTGANGIALRFTTQSLVARRGSRAARVKENRRRISAMVTAEPRLAVSSNYAGFQSASILLPGIELDTSRVIQVADFIRAVHRAGDRP